MSEEAPTESVDEVAKAELQEVPVFPLPQIVFFPRSHLPLHLFEPRYRALVEETLEAGKSLMAIAQLAPGWEGDYEGQPAVREIAGLGRIVAHRRRPNGTHDIVLWGLGRVRVEELPLSAQGYRLARCAPVPNEGASRVTPADRAALLAVASSLAGEVRRRHPDFDLGLDPDLDIGALADTVADRLVVDPLIRQRILETAAVDRRVETVTEALGDLLLRITPPSSAS